MVGRLIQNQQIRLLQQQLGNGKPGLFSAAEAGNDPVIGILPEAHAVEDGLDLHVDQIPIPAFKKGSKPAVFFGHYIQSAVHLRLQLPHPVCRLQYIRKDAAHFRIHRTAALQSPHLLQVTHRGFGGTGDHPIVLNKAIRLLLSGEDPQKGGLAAAVGAHQTDTLPFVDGQVHAVQDLPAVVVFMNIR